MDEGQTDRRAMTRAAEILGGAEPLSARLGVPQERVERWIAGEESIPVGMFSLAVAVMLENSDQHHFTQKK
jgi:DNA-binding transcriptional regulator YdaS (Cro superfamily)